MNRNDRRSPLRLLKNLPGPKAVAKMEVIEELPVKEDESPVVEKEVQAEVPVKPVEETPVAEVQKSGRGRRKKDVEPTPKENVGDE